MPRKAYPVKRAQALLEEWIALRVPKSPHEAPITIEAAVAHLKAKSLPTHRSTLHLKGLTKLIAEGSRRQAEEGGGRERDRLREEYEALLSGLRVKNEKLEVRNRELLGVIATMAFNARRLGVSDAELCRDLPLTNRSESRAGKRKGSRQLV